MVLRHSPYGSGLARASIDLALAFAAFEQDIELLFLGDGVLQLLTQQDSASIGRKNAGKMLSSLPLVDIETVYVDADALARHGLSEADLILPVKPVSGDALRQLLANCDHLLGC